MLDHEVTPLLNDADRTVARLEKLCCEPGRSPAMQAIAGHLAAARSELDGFSGDEATATSIIALLEETGGRVGRLQVGCCAPARMPLYADLLTSLTELQRRINASIGRGH